MMATLATFTTAIPTSNSGTSSLATIEKRACPYPDGNPQCTLQENLKCTQACSGRARQIAICNHECTFSTTEICKELGC